MAELLDDALHKEILLTEPLLELPGERNLKTILGYPEQSPCSCLAEMICYPVRPTTYIFWDVQDIMKNGLPPSNGKVYYLTLKASIIVSWFHERTEDWQRGIAPTREVVNSLYIQDYDLYDTFVIVAKPWEHIQASWYCSKDRPRVFSLFIRL